MNEPTLTKRCTACGLPKPLSGFDLHPRGRYGRKSRCRLCLSSEERQANADGNRSPRSAQSAEQHNQLKREQQQNARTQVLEHYGTSCACCGSTKQLTIDHVNGDGASHRLTLFGRGSSSGTGKLYRWLVEQGFPDGFQTLCNPCNASKASGEHCRLHLVR